MVVVLMIVAITRTVTPFCVFLFTLPGPNIRRNKSSSRSDRVALSLGEVLFTFRICNKIVVGRINCSFLRRGVVSVHLSKKKTYLCYLPVTWLIPPFSFACCGKKITAAAAGTA
uniref:(northern house mosquito) hypothetical protein n=1 Tax=Culex pipiens TaxID=7175 RepID=A0A8D8HZD5_CULPI